MCLDGLQTRELCQNCVVFWCKFLKLLDRNIWMVPYLISMMWHFHDFFFMICWPFPLPFTLLPFLFKKAFKKLYICFSFGSVQNLALIYLAFIWWFFLYDYSKKHRSMFENNTFNECTNYGFIRNGL